MVVTENATDTLAVGGMTNRAERDIRSSMDMTTDAANSDTRVFTLSLVCWVGSLDFSFSFPSAWVRETGSVSANISTTSDFALVRPPTMSLQSAFGTWNFWPSPHLLNPRFHTVTRIQGMATERTFTAHFQGIRRYGYYGDEEVSRVALTLDLIICCLLFIR